MLIRPSTVELFLLANITIVRIRESGKKESENKARSRGTSGRRIIITRGGQSERKSRGRAGETSEAHLRLRERRQPVEPGALARALGIGARSAGAIDRARRRSEKRVH